jgi:hypothetical protein
MVECGCCQLAMLTSCCSSDTKLKSRTLSLKQERERGGDIYNECLVFFYPSAEKPNTGAT